MFANATSLAMVVRLLAGGTPGVVVDNCSSATASPGDALVRVTHSSPARLCTPGLTTRVPRLQAYMAHAAPIFEDLSHGSPCGWVLDEAAESEASLVHIDAGDHVISLSPALLALLPEATPSRMLRNMSAALAPLVEYPVSSLWRRVLDAGSPLPKALECAACIVLGSFASLIVANVGGLAIGNHICNCAHLTPASCKQLLQGILYVVIALLPVIAVVVFEACKTVCTSSDAEVRAAAQQLLAASAPPPVVGSANATNATVLAPDVMACFAAWDPNNLTTAHLYTACTMGQMARESDDAFLCIETCKSNPFGHPGQHDPTGECQQTAELPRCIQACSLGCTPLPAS